MRRLWLVLLSTLAVQAPGCATVKPWEKALLAERSMDPANRAEAMREDFVGHGLDIREGATGGRGVAGGGCGCN